MLNVFCMCFGRRINVITKLDFGLLVSKTCDHKLPKKDFEIFTSQDGSHKNISTLTISNESISSLNCNSASWKSKSLIILSKCD